MNENILDKRVIYINSSNCKYLNNNDCSFFYDLLEPIRNVVYVKLMKAELIVNPSGNINSAAIQDGDPVFVSLNNYSRLYTTIKETVSLYDIKKKTYYDEIQSRNVKCFECISLNISDKYGAGSVPNKLVSFKSEYTATGCTVNDTNTYVLDPIDPNLKRLDISLFDKKFNLVGKNDINTFNMILCVYASRKKVTME
jgi:UDP-N-acetylglucosamine 2-epimerase